MCLKKMSLSKYLYKTLLIQDKKNQYKVCIQFCYTHIYNLLQKATFLKTSQSPIQIVPDQLRSQLNEDSSKEP